MKLKELRGNTTQQEICNKLGLSVKNLSNYEIGRTEPDIKTLIKLANYFNVSLDYLCERPFNNNIGYIPEDKRKAVLEILSLSERQTQRVLDFISGIKADI